jgi:hypothetical protein
MYPLSDSRGDRNGTGFGKSTTALITIDVVYPTSDDQRNKERARRETY